ncbi:MAG: ribonuclease P protein component [Geminicoccaceae bacterium]
MSIERLKTRAEFLRCARGPKAALPSLVLQSFRHDDKKRIGVGFTASKRVGGAVVRNRAKRRLREAIRLIAPTWARAGHDYVVIARTTTPFVPFDRILADLSSAFGQVAKGKRA